MIVRQASSADAAAIAALHAESCGRTYRRLLRDEFFGRTCRARPARRLGGRLLEAPADQFGSLIEHDGT